ncbi:MAG: hypothetical protein DME22_24000 [Verrucomicrobia bacterium]|nr:MAG: hypothetical protein DME22_24000 [Verrucomicrobiota bacterium]
MVAGFLVQQATKIPVIERVVAGTAADAKSGLDALLAKSATQGRDLGFGGSLEGRPSISRTDPGFGGLAILYYALIAKDAKPGDRMDTISRFIDPCALVPDKRGYANMVVVEWEHGAKTKTSYEEIRELIAKKSDAAIRPWQYSLFFIGLLVNIATFKLTYFPKAAPKVVEAEAKRDDERAEKTEHGEPAKKE